MHVNNVIIQAVGFAEHGCAFQTPGPNVQVGLFFDDADGTATDVTVRNITQHSGCQTGNGIRANARAGTARTVTLTGVTVTGYMKNGVTGSGQMTLNVGGNSTIGPPDAVPGLNTTNGVQYGDGGAGGTFTGNTVIGAGAGTPPDGSSTTAILLSSAANVTIANNTITGAGTDLGIAVFNSTNVTISNNAVGRTAPDSPDPAGIGILVYPSATNVTLDLQHLQWLAAEQEHRRRSPDVVYAAAQRHRMHHLLGRHLQCRGWHRAVYLVGLGGTLPPGLTLAPSTGAISGTPTEAGTFNFTVTVVDSTQPTLTATQAQTITIAPGCASTVQVIKTFVGDPSSTTIFVDQNGTAPYDASTVAAASGASASFTYPLSTPVTVGEEPVPAGYTATVACGSTPPVAYTGGAFPVTSPATDGATITCTITNTAPRRRRHHHRRRRRRHRRHHHHHHHRRHRPPSPRPPPPPPKPKPQPVLVSRQESRARRRLRSGKSVGFTIARPRRAGPGTARNVQVCDGLPDGLVFVRAPWCAVP